jgi:hypothetical protein
VVTITGLSPDSIGGFQRSSLHRGSVKGSEELVGCVPVQGFTRSSIELVAHLYKVSGGMHTKVGTLREVVAKESVGILVTRSLPRAAPVTEEHWHPCRLGDLVVMAHLDTLIPHERPA